jgi:hypothetical protein
MKTYKDKSGKYVSEKPKIFEVGVDYFNRPIYNNSLVYFFSDYNSHVRQLEYDFEACPSRYFNNSVVIKTNQISSLLTYLTKIFNKENSGLLTCAPNIGDIIVLRTINHKFKVIDNTPKLFIKAESLEVSDYTPIFGIYELELLDNKTKHEK